VQAVQSAIDELPIEIAKAIETLAAETANQRNTESRSGVVKMVEYTAARLRFVRSRIEELQPGGLLRIHVPSQGTFELSRENFETDFRNVLDSRSYQEAGYYHYASVPVRALKYRVSD
jgi:hypothetical protein